MTNPLVTDKVARAIYEYAGTDGLPLFENLSPTVQISYVEEAEAAILAVTNYVKFLACQIDVEIPNHPGYDQQAAMAKATLLSLADMLDPYEDKRRKRH
jgi:hypothetical protein